MRILIATGIFEPETGGPATYAPELAKRLTEVGHTIKVVTYVPKSITLPPGYPYEVVQVARTANKIGNRIAFFRSVWRESKGSDLIYTLDWFAAGLPVALAAQVRRIPYIVRVGGDYHWERYLERNEPVTLAEFYGKNMHLLFSRLPAFFAILYVLRRAAFIIFNSDRQRNLYKYYYRIPGVRTSVVQNPVPEVERRSRGAPMKEFVFWGRLVAMKNLDKLIRSFGQAQIPPDYRLTIIGDGPLRLHLEDLTYELSLEKRVKFESAMPRADVLRRVQNARATIIPSWTDISPNQVYEALAIHLPALVTKENYLSIADRLPATIDPHSVKDITEKIEMLADDAAYETFSKKFNAIAFAHSWSDVVREHLAIFKRVI